MAAAKSHASVRVVAIAVQGTNKPMQLNTSDATALRQLRRAAFAPGIQAVMQKIIDDARSQYESGPASDERRGRLNALEQAKAMLFHMSLTTP